MSKIVDALRRIQEERGSGARHASPAARRIARLEPRADTVGSAEPDGSEATAVLQSSRIVTVDKEAMRDAGLIAPENEAKFFEDEYRVIKRPILRNAFEEGAAKAKNGFALLVTSALAGDGKTFTCINLAMSVAREQDTSVLLIDADAPKPQISSLFDASGQPGLLDYLDGRASAIEEIEIHTNVAGLSIIPSGSASENATELFAGKRMKGLLDRLHQRNPRQLVVFDSSPLLQTTESRALVAVAGQVVLVVRAGITPKDAVRNALATLDLDKPTNLILNQVRISGGKHYYRDYYGGYGSGYGEGNEEKD